MIITGHSSKKPFNNMRVFSDQEIDTSKLFSGITKYYARIDNSKNVQYKILAKFSIVRGMQERYKNHRELIITCSCVDTDQ